MTGGWFLSLVQPLSHKFSPSGRNVIIKQRSPVKWKWCQPWTRKQLGTCVWEYLENGKGECTKLISEMRSLPSGWLLMVVHGDCTDTGCPDSNRPPGTNEGFSIVPSPENLPLVSFIWNSFSCSCGVSAPSVSRKRPPLPRAGRSPSPRRTGPPQICRTGAKRSESCLWCPVCEKLSERQLNSLRLSGREQGWGEQGMQLRWFCQTPLRTYHGSPLSNQDDSAWQQGSPWGPHSPTPTYASNYWAVQWLRVNTGGWLWFQAYLHHLLLGNLNLWRFPWFPSL